MLSSKRRWMHSNVMHRNVMICNAILWNIMLWYELYCFQVNIGGCTERLCNVMPPKASVDALKCNAPKLSKNNVTTMQQLTTYVQFTLLRCLQVKCAISLNCWKILNQNILQYDATWCLYGSGALDQDWSWSKQQMSHAQPLSEMLEKS